MIRSRRDSRSHAHPWYTVALPAALLLIAFALARHGLRELLLCYLSSWLLLLSVALGSISWLLIHCLTGGDWGEHLRGDIDFGMGVLPYVALMATPLLVGARVIFPWLAPGAMSNDPALLRQSWYLNQLGLSVRLVCCFVVWAIIVAKVRRSLCGARRPLGRGVAAVSLIAMLISTFVVAVDWIMSLTPQWHSSDIGLILFAAALLASFALALLTRLLHTPMGLLSAQTQRDFCLLLLVALLGWAYIAFMDYLTAWIADQPYETVWYLPRLRTDWWLVAQGLIVFGFVLPFVTLLSPLAKVSWRVLTAVVVIVLIVQWVNMIWLVLPSSEPTGMHWSWNSVLVCFSALGLCLPRYMQRSDRRRPTLNGEAGAS